MRLSGSASRRAVPSRAWPSAPVPLGWERARQGVARQSTSGGRLRERREGSKRVEDGVLSVLAGTASAHVCPLLRDRPLCWELCWAPSSVSVGLVAVSIADLFIQQVFLGRLLHVPICARLPGAPFAGVSVPASAHAHAARDSGRCRGHCHSTGPAPKPGSGRVDAQEGQQIQLAGCGQQSFQEEPGRVCGSQQGGRALSWRPRGQPEDGEPASGLETPAASSLHGAGSSSQSV